MNLINRVTVTGADDSVRVEDLVKIQEEYPFVEWGILLSKSSEGGYRFPSLEWINVLNAVAKKLTLSGHLCGKWVRDICGGKETLFEERPQFKGLFDRYQLNFHAYAHKIKSTHSFILALKSLKAKIILQFDNVNNDLLNDLRLCEVDASPLFDTSGGAGVLPNHWPNAIGYCGYAGGLSPGNLHEQMLLISRVCEDGPIWIDAETKLRSDDDSQFDLDKVCQFLEEAKPWMVEE